MLSIRVTLPWYLVSTQRVFSLPVRDQAALPLGLLTALARAEDIA